MALRVMQICLPKDSDSNLNKLLEGRDILGRWRDSDSEKTVLHLLVPAEETEPIMDRFEQEFSAVEGFHVVLFPVEAVLPRPQMDPDQQEETKQGADAESAFKKANRISREELYAEVDEGLGITRVYLGLTILSAIVAAVGLLRDDVAVIIGAMVIAPLLGPNVALSLGTTLGDIDLIRRALITSLAGLAVAFGFSVVVGVLFTVQPDIPAIAARTQVNLGDILLALAAGAAGTLAFTRGLSGAVIGVMVAVALVPPLVVCGMLLGAGLPDEAFRASLLTATNVICINLSGVAIFLLQGVRPRRWAEAERAKMAATRATIIWTVLLAILAVILWLTGF
jgi:uncharacterized hydrophobic protein (TIGR00341 family)